MENLCTGFEKISNQMNAYKAVVFVIKQTVKSSFYYFSGKCTE